MPPFHRPGASTPAKRASAPVRHSDAEIARKRAAFTEAERLFRKPVAKAAPAPAAPGPSAFLSNYGGSNNLPTLAPASVARKADAAPLHPKAAALASRCGQRGAAVLSAIAVRSDEERGAPIEITAADVAKLVGVDVASATTLLTDLRASGLLIEKRSTFGISLGFVLAGA